MARATPGPPAAPSAHPYGTADQHRPRAEAERLDDVAAAADAAVHEHLDAIADGGDDFRQHAQRRRHAIELTAAVVRHDDRIGTGIDRLPRARRRCGRP